MAYAPATPFPKGRGDSIRSADWNEAMNELIRLETAKFDKTGGTVSGNLTVTGTISGTLANNIVGPNQIAANAVTTVKLADGNVTNAKLANGSVTGLKVAAATVTPDKLSGGFNNFNTTITLGGAVNSIFGIFISMDLLDATPPPEPLASLLFVTTNTNNAIFTYHLEYRRFLDGSSRPNGGNVLWFTNKVAVTTEIVFSVYNFRRA